MRDDMEEYMTELTKKFQDFVLDSMSEGYHVNFLDHFDFLKACMEIWTKQMEEGEE